ncbi:class I SAM-dependent methyltransferase [Candidatus Woesearchaeota archaeon]|jgi:ubiquinone/menaquinone biosynthesis C-methylase UbiE|nr:class I SAM-dependent methyltransferase [Candidatus Woesearchaeota archaeon]MBT5396607.1 class I SAM-dependent methyltransferase [Candidatus Woesearchaeota archaeon]MBT5924438.1 class I SAM-dependent methyltransferase [Candidatus Woesearchaeota archaeon]MBT6368001.1 class I SAM-dependent methyltransferase [Candidatus Woesearchaeota archaeon]MBT7762227.1 class I SAM-dependent methyltransferase [Candidatus Woesearchaeota archaeon]
MSENDFLCGLMELQYGIDVKEKLCSLSSSVPWAHGWPENVQSFWNAEAFMWSRKISKEKRMLIQQELSFLTGKNLDIGCGAYSYITSVGFDISPKMLDFNDMCTEKVVGDVEKPLPFPEKSFDSITTIFLLNYVKNHTQLISEITRVLKHNGKFVMVLSSNQINDWQKQKEVNCFRSDEWTRLLQQSGFVVNFYKKDDLWFWKCRI